MSKTIVSILFTVAASIGIGIYLSHLNNNSGIFHAASSEFHSEDVKKSEVLVYIDEEPLLWSDVDWEFEFYKKNLLIKSGNEEEEKPAVNEEKFPFEVSDEKLNPLKTQLTGNLIERKLLYHFIQLDPSFRFDDPGRYVSCIEEWKNSASFINDPQGRERLKSQICEKSIIDQYISEVLNNKVLVKEKEIEDYYKDNKKKFYYPEKVLIRQIVLGSEQEAKQVRSRVNSGNFSYIAKTKSIAPEAESGGLLGPFSRGQMPRIFDVAFTMRVGEIRSILKSTYGFHLIKLERKYAKKQLTLEQASKNIIEILTQEKRELEYQKWVELALSAINIKSPKIL